MHITQVLTGELCIPLNVPGELAVRGNGVDEVLGDKEGAADVLLLDIPDICIFTSIQYIALNESNTNQFLSYFQITISFTAVWTWVFLSLCLMKPQLLHWCSKTRPGLYELSPGVQFEFYA